MAVVFDKLLGIPLLHEHVISKVTSDPTTARDGQLIINTSDGKLKVFYAYTWQTILTLSVPAGNTGSPMGLLLALTYS